MAEQEATIHICTTVTVDTDIEVDVGVSEAIEQLKEQGYVVLGPNPTGDTDDPFLKMWEALHYRNDLATVKRIIMDFTGRVLK